MARETYIMHNGELVLKARDGELTETYLNLPRETQSIYQGYGRDDLGTKGIFNHADGKTYDSKSNYNRAVVASGCRIVGNDYNKSQWKPPAERGIRGDFNVRPALKQAIDKVMQ